MTEQGNFFRFDHQEDGFQDNRHSHVYPNFTAENLKYMIPDKAVVTKLEAIAGGTRKQRETAQKELIKQATQGDANDLLDVCNATILALVARRYKNTNETPPQLEFIQNLTPPTAESLRNIRGFLVDFFRNLSQEARVYTVDLSKQSNKAKVALAQMAFDTLGNIMPEADESSFRNPNQTRFPDSFYGLKQSVGMISDIAKSGYTIIALNIPAELTARENQKVVELAGKDVKDFTQNEFDLLLKAYNGYHRGPRDIAFTKLNEVYTQAGDNLNNTVSWFNKSLSSTDRAVKNSAVRALLTYTEDDPTWMDKKAFFGLVQFQLSHVMRGDGVDLILQNNIESLILTLASQSTRDSLIRLLIHEVINASTVEVDKNFIDLLEKPKVQTPGTDILLRIFREFKNDLIPEDTFLELFDERRALGFFMDNLKVNWQGLQRITRERIWPSFITERGAKLWPSEEEIPIETYTGKHMAAVLGITDLRFFIRGYARPETGLEFHFNNHDKVLRGMIDRQGHLTNLPFDLEESHPHIHALMERLAVCGLQSMVTVASRRFVVKGRGEYHPADPDKEIQATVVSLPRHETSYIDLDPRPRMTIDEVIADAIKAARMSVPIPQKVVPLAYAARYEMYRNKLVKERAKGSEADPVMIKEYEGEMATNFSKITKPSDDKKDNLPKEFELRQVGEKYIETWRKKHFRPRLDHEPSFEEAYERRYRLAPVVQDLDLETWFTTPPQG